MGELRDRGDGDQGGDSGAELPAEVTHGGDNVRRGDALPDAAQSDAVDPALRLSDGSVRRWSDFELDDDQAAAGRPSEATGRELEPGVGVVEWSDGAGERQDDGSATVAEQPRQVERNGEPIERPEFADQVRGRFRDKVEDAKQSWELANEPYGTDARKNPQIDHPDLPRPGDEPDISATGYERCVKRTLDGPVDPPLFGPDGPQREDVRQGQFGDCWALSAMRGVAGHQPDKIANIIKESPDGDGFEVSLHQAAYEKATGDFVPTGRRLDMTVSKDMPVDANEAWKPDRRTVGAKYDGPGVSWTAGLEKAFAGVDEFWPQNRPNPSGRDGYARINQGGAEIDIAEALTQMTGERSGAIDLHGAEDPSSVERTLRGQLDSGNPVIVGTLNDRERPGLRENYGLYGSHAYEVVSVNDGGVVMRNPWGWSHPRTLSIDQFLDTTRGMIVTTSPDRARKELERG